MLHRLPGMPDSSLLASSQEALARALRQEGLRLLVRREHSRAELRQKLGQYLNKAPAAVELDENIRTELLEAALDALNDKRWQSDERFAQQRVTQRGKRYGNQRLKQELAQRGVDSETIESALETGESELARCHQVWLKKFGGPASDREGLAKQLRFLQYRGFSGDIIRRVLNNDLSDADSFEQ